MTFPAFAIAATRSDNISQAEYDDLGTRGVTFPAFAIAATRSDNISQDVDMGILRLNYRFGGSIATQY